jgi:hypothetical protein
MALHPVGPLPAATYWRRRLVLLAVLIGLVLLARSAIGGGGEPSTPRTGASPTPKASTTHSATPKPKPTTAAGPTTCRDGALALTVAPDAGEHRAGAPVRFTVTVKNVSGTACRRDLGGGSLELVVRSGQDRIWSSDDCSTDRGSAVQLLRAGASLQTVVTWPGKRSARGCPTARPEARAGTYTARARLGTLRSDATVFRLTS